MEGAIQRHRGMVRALDWSCFPVEHPSKVCDTVHILIAKGLQLAGSPVEQPKHLELGALFSGLKLKIRTALECTCMSHALVAMKVHSLSSAA